MPRLSRRSRSIPPTISAPPPQHRRPLPTGRRRAGGEEHLLPPIQYPAAMDYSRPAQKGLDDVGSFLADSRENPEPVTPPAEKPGFLARLLRRKKDNKDNE